MARAKARKWILDAPWVTSNVIGFGVYQYTLFSRNYVGPLGMVWFIPFGKTAYVLDSHTTHWARRSGVRSKIQEELAKNYRKIVTGANSNSKEGLAFLRSQGYVFNRAFGEASLVVKGKSKTVVK